MPARPERLSPRTGPRATRSGARSARRFTGGTGGALVATLLSALPAVEVAHAELAADRWPGADTAAQVPDGGVLRLRAPATEMIRVPTSSFIMGSGIVDVVEAAASCRRASAALRGNLPDADGPCAEDRFALELSAHPVTLSAYWLDRTEVTVAGYRRCVALGRCQPLPYQDGAARFDRPELPAVMVRWEDARDYCRFRGARLATEAEFERAARGPAGRRYPWGNAFHRKAANHGRFGWDRASTADGFAELAPIGSFPAGRTPDGFLDLAGNAAEWVSDRFSAPYSAAAARDPQGPATAFVPGATSERIVRGGSFEEPPAYLRGAARFPADPAIRDPSVGFRCARSATRAPAETP